MSSDAIGWVFKHSPFDGPTFVVHLALGDVANDVHDYELWMSTETLAKKAHVSRSTAVRALRELTEAGFLEVVKPGGATRKPTVYRMRGLTETPTSVTQTPTRFRESHELEVTQGTTQLAASASQSLAAADCPRCLGSGFFYSGAGFDRPCPCTEREATA